MDKIELSYSTSYGKYYHGKIEDALSSKEFSKYKNKINLVFTSPPFPLNRKKKYGNLNGNDYSKWLSEITTKLKDYITENGSLVIEIGNTWEENKPFMSTLPLETLLEIKKEGGYNLCQQFIWYNTAKLPSPIQWVNIERIRVKDAYTNIWWLSKGMKPKANNLNIKEDYSISMKKLLKRNKYNHGLRPSDHNIGEKSFLIDNMGSIPSNVLVGANTSSNTKYLNYCRKEGIIPHPARMPDFIAEYFIKYLTEVNDIILDPFAGSNTTGKVSESLKRRWLAIEINDYYINGSKYKFGLKNG